MLRPEDHERHESEAEREACVNCQLERLTAAFTPFESFTLSFYRSFFTELGRSSGVAAIEYSRLGYDYIEREVLVEALETLRELYQKISNEKAEDRWQTSKS